MNVEGESEENSLTVSSKNKTGIFVDGKLDVICGELSASSENTFAIASNEGTTIADSIVTAKGRSYGMSSDGDNTIINSIVTASGDDYGIYSEGNNIIDGSDVTAEGGERAIYTAPTLKGVYNVTEGESTTEASAVSAYTDEKYASFEFVAKENPFVDLYKGTVYYDAVLWAVDEGITNGTDATHLSPNANCTRGQVVTFLWRVAGSPEPTDMSNLDDFTDANKIANPYKKAVAWAVEKGITNGFADGTFCSNDTVTRAQFVTFLWRYFEKPAPAGTENSFVDVSNTSVLKDAILWALGENITNGFDPTHFRPNDTCSRWQVVLFMFRAFD